MKKFFPVIILLGIILLIGFLFAGAKKRDDKLLKNIEGKMVYFYSEKCPHCLNVERFFEENQIEEKIQFEKKKIDLNEENKKLLFLIAKRKCFLKDNEIGVPLFWDTSQCILGDQPIINYFKEKLSA